MEASTSPDSRPEPIDLSHLYSKVTTNRTTSRVKDFYKYFAIPGIGNLAGGMPNNNYFPYDTLEATAALPNRFTPTPNKPVDPPADLLSKTTLSDGLSSSRVVVPKTSDNQDILRKIDLKTALQYGTAQGYPPLYSFLRQFTIENLHPNVPYAGGPEIILTCGATDGFCKAIDALSNTWNEDRDWIGHREGLLVEEFCYMNAVQTAKPRGLNIVPVAVDDEGMVAHGEGGVLDVLENWDRSRGKRPHMIYTVTIGQNPTSGTLSVERRKAIYAICVKFDVVIIEDDPYWYLQYPSASESSLGHRGIAHSDHLNLDPPKPQKSSGYDFLDSLVPSYLSVDYQGRVVRLDTFSKTIAPGCRLGWITTQPNLCERLLRITETSTQQPSGFVQSMVAELIMGPHDPKHGRGGGRSHGGWQVDGWVRWLQGLRGNYERRMQTMCSILDGGKELVRSGRRKSIDNEWSVVDKVTLFDFTWPLGGMFVWVHLNFPSHPLWNTTTPAKLAQGLWVHLTTENYRVLVGPGAIFSPTDEIRDKRSWAYFRICFAAVDESEVEKMSKRFVDGVKDFWEKKSLDDIEESTRGFESSEGLANFLGGC
ncbi:hypothetical protein IMSHALPRED_002388 [Imshaugia aleurites]|uniref:Aromatic amino acid aminotransferase n=1 Tax=Imshaugia aleurites TaxID=172621 RepID=A0A8H3IC42_9LECA|nr:hypothetical protein IMSHALPRED_002388 [Imshaugia aleurites]